MIKREIFPRLAIHLLIGVGYQIFISIQLINTEKYAPFGSVFQFVIWAFWHAIGTLLYCVIKKILNKNFEFLKELQYQFIAYFIVVIFNFYIGQLASGWLEIMWSTQHSK